MENLNIMIDNYIELSVIKKVNDETYLLELMNNIKNEIDGLMPDELKEVYQKYIKISLDIKAKIIEYETSRSKYDKNKENKSILLSAFFYSISKEIDELKNIRQIYQEILLYIKEVRRKRRVDSILRLTKKINFL